MTHIFEQPMLSLSPQSIYRIPDVDIDDLSAMWNVFTKCKAHLENGQRLENMSWRLWHHERQQSIQQQHRTDYFSYIPTCSSSPENNSPTSSTGSSSGDSTSSTSIKRFLSTLSPGHDVWSHLSTMRSSSSSSCNNSGHGNDAGDTSVAADVHSNNNNHKPMPANNTPPPSPHIPNVVIAEQTSNTGFSESHDRQARQQQDCPRTQDNQHPILPQPKATSVAIIVGDDDDEEDDDDDELLMQDDGDYGPDKYDDHFKKTEPHRPPPRPSLLSAMLEQRQQLGMRSTAIATRIPYYTIHSNTRAPQVAPTEHFLRKELSESLRRNVLWEHIQQRTLYHRNVTHRRPRWKNENNPSDHPGDGWQENFQGW